MTAGEHLAGRATVAAKEVITFSIYYFQDRMRALYNEWLDSGKQTTTAAGNVRAPSRTDICDMVSQAWNDLSEEMIAKSFANCGQTKDGIPEDVTCMKEGRVAAPALEKVKQFWNFNADQFVEDVNQNLEADENEDFVVVDENDEDEEAHDETQDEAHDD